MHRLVLQVATGIFSWLVPKAIREPVMGDLAEGYALRAKAVSPSAAFKWYLQQICASILPMLWTRLRQATWLATLGVAFLAYISVGVAQFIIRWATASSDESLHRPLEVIFIFPVVVLIGFFAERLRRRAAIVLGAMMLLAITAMTLSTTESVPLWYRVAWFIVGPAAAAIGSALNSPRRRRP